MNKPRTTSPGSRGRGRPAGNPDTKGEIARTARRLFLANGYASTSLRAIAREAGVDAALIGYHFGSKARLFSAALELTKVPADLLDEALAGDPVGAPERIVATVLRAWDDPAFGGPLAEMMRAALREEDLLRAMSEYISSAIGQQIVEFLGGPDARAQAAAAEAVLGGMVLGRYVVRLEPLASLTSQQVIAAVAPALRAGLGGTPRLAARRHRP